MLHDRGDPVPPRFVVELFPSEPTCDLNSVAAIKQPSTTTSDRFVHVVKRFVINQPVALILSCETFNQIVLMLKDTAMQIVCHSDVQRARLARDHVHAVIVFLHTAHLPCHPDRVSRTAEAGRRPCHSIPNLLKPFLIILRRDHAQNSCAILGSSVAAWLPLHQNELDVVLDDCIRLVGLSEEAPAVLYFVRCIGNFVPDDWRQIIEANPPAMFLNSGMEGNDGMSSFILAPREADVPDHAHQSSAHNQGVKTSLPNSIQFFDEVVVVDDVTKLTRTAAILFQSPIGWRVEACCCFSYPVTASQQQVPRLRRLSALRQRALTLSTPPSSSRNP